MVCFSSLNSASFQASSPNSLTFHSSLVFLTVHSLDFLCLIIYFQVKEKHDCMFCERAAENKDDYFIFLALCVTNIGSQADH